MVIRKSFALFLVILFLCGCSQSQNGDNEGNDNDENKGGGIVAGKIDTSIGEEQENGMIYFQFHLKNQTEHVETYHFNTGQRYDYVIKNEQGKKMIQFSKGMMFTQVLGEETLKQGETKTYKARISDLPAGQYTIKFWLTAKEDQPSASLEFKVE